MYFSLAGKERNILSDVMYNVLAHVMYLYKMLYPCCIISVSSKIVIS